MHYLHNNYFNASKNNYSLLTLWKAMGQLATILFGRDTCISYENNYVLYISNTLKLITYKLKRMYSKCSVGKLIYELI